MNIDALWPRGETARHWPALPRWYRLFRPLAAARPEQLGPISGTITPWEQRRKLLFAIDSLTGGGAERVMCQVANGLDPSRYEIQIALTLGSANVQDVTEHVTVVDLTAQIPEDPYFRRFPAKTLEVAAAAILSRLSHEAAPHQTDLAMEIHNLRVMTLVLGRHVLAWEPDCILSFLPNTNLLSLLARAWYGFQTPLICADHNHLSSELQNLPWPELRHFFITRHYPFANRHLAVAPESAEDLIENFGVPGMKVVTIPNGVDSEKVRALAAQPIQDDELPSNPGELLIVSVGRLATQKGYDILLQALRRLRAKPWRLLLLGEGAEQHALCALAAQLGLANKVHFLGWKPNPYQWMIRSDLFVLSSRWEAWPVVMLEALALGLPIVATDCAGAPARILERGRYGRLVPPNSPDALAAAIDEMLSNESLRQHFGRLAGGRAAVFGLPVMIPRYDQLLREVIANG